MDSELDSHALNKVLLIAFHYPPVNVSSGIQRTLAFSRYLPDSGWQPIVLSAHPRAYPSVSDQQLRDIPQGMLVKRAFALDSARHFSIKGRYLDILALPDRWVSWLLGGVISGLKLVRSQKPAVIWSTYPIATAHLIGLVLQRLTGLPWVADFRDAMLDDVYPAPGARRRCHAWLERKVVEACSAAVFTTPGAVELYRQRYPYISDSKWHLIPNGFNEDIFEEVEIESKKNLESSEQKPFLLLHSGVLYPSERDPQPFFDAISELKNEGKISSKRLCVVLRATGHDELYQPVLDRLDINDVVTLAGGISYREALSEMLSADGLLIFQASNCNHQIPAKIYEYFRAQRPIFALTDNQGDTAKALLEAGQGSIVALDNKDAIKAGLDDFLQKVRAGEEVGVTKEAAQKYSRRAFSADLGEVLYKVSCSNKE